MREKGDSAFDDVVDEDGSGEPDTEEPPAESGTDGSPGNGSSEDADTTGTETADSVSDSEPGFPFAATDQHPVYIKQETWEALQDAKYYTEGELIEEFGVRNLETREFDQAIAQLIVEELTAAEIAAKIVENRGFD